MAHQRCTVNRIFEGAGQNEVAARDSLLCQMQVGLPQRGTPPPTPKVAELQVPDSARSACASIECAGAASWQVVKKFG